MTYNKKNKKWYYSAKENEKYEQKSKKKKNSEEIFRYGVDGRRGGGEVEIKAKKNCLQGDRNT